MNIAEKLRKLREEKGISQYKLIEELEEKENVSVAISSIRNYENINSPRIPQGEILLALSKYYDVTLEYLIDDNITTYKKENLNIGKELYLTETTIRTMHILKNMELMDTFNEFVSNDVIYQILIIYKALKELKIFINYIDNISLLITDNGEIKYEFNFDEYDEVQTNKFLNSLKDKILILEKCLKCFVEKNQYYLEKNPKYNTIFNIINFDKSILPIFNDIDKLKKIYESRIKEYNDNKKKNIIKLNFNNEEYKIYTSIYKNMLQIKIELEAYIDILVYNISYTFSSYINFDITNIDINKTIKEYENLFEVNRKSSTLNGDD